MADPGCTEETVLELDKRRLHITVDGKDVPVGRFVQGFIMNTIAGMLSALKKVDLSEDSLIEIRMRYRK